MTSGGHQTGQFENSIGWHLSNRSLDGTGDRGIMEVKGLSPHIGLADPRGLKPVVRGESQTATYPVYESILDPGNR